MFKWRGKMTEIGLGPSPRISLADARRKAEDARRKLDEGIHPKKEAQDDHAPTFGDFADEYIALNEPSWRNDKHRAQWRMTLGRARTTDGKLTKKGYCLSLAKKPVDEITVEDVLAEISPIWHDKPETASRIRGRIEIVLDAAKARGHRTGENPATWKGNLALILPKRSKARASQHFPAMPYADVPGFVALLRNSASTGALALEFLILTAARSGEVREATWDEIDLAGALWTVPADRMKGGKEHRVPLPARAVEILQLARTLHQFEGNFIFPGMKRGRPLSDMTLTAIFRRMKLEGVTAHGFRSSFRDWAGDCTHYARELIEQALAHVVGGVEGAYRRSDALEKRRSLMVDWEAFVEAQPANPEKVVPIRRGAEHG
jgi:integrase